MRDPRYFHTTSRLHKHKLWTSHPIRDQGQVTWSRITSWLPEQRPFVKNLSFFTNMGRSPEHRPICLWDHLMVKWPSWEELCFHTLIGCADLITFWFCYGFLVIPLLNLERYFFSLQTYLLKPFQEKTSSYK